MNLAPARVCISFGLVLACLAGLVTPASGQAQNAPAVPTPPTTQPSAPDDAELADEDIELLELEVPTVVTAARREQKINAVPYAISVITAEDIRRSGARNVPEALRLAAGVDVAALSFGNYAVSARGFHSFMANKILVLVDGRQIFDSLMAGTFWGSHPFQLEDIERIEVIRGPGGVTWGPNAVNGVINIITKDPADQLGLTITAGGGSRTTHKEHVGYAFQVDNLRMRMSGEYEASEGHNRGGLPLIGPLDDRYRGGRMGLHAIYDAGPRDTLVFSGGSSVLRDNWPEPPLSILDALRPRCNANYLLGKWTHRINDDNSWELTGYVNDFHHMSGISWTDYRYQQYAVQFAHTFKLAEKHLLTWGVDTRFDYTDASNAEPFMLSENVVRSFTAGVYVHDEWSFAPRWTLNLGGRVDYDSYGGWEPSARAALCYQLNQSALVYGAVSRAVHVPPSGRRFMDMPTLGGLIRIQSSGDINNETLLAYELGYRGQLFDRLDLGANVFLHRYSDLNTSISGDGPPGMLLISNGGGKPAKACLYGTELELKYRATDRLDLLGHYTFQNVKWRVPGTILDTNVMAPPKHKFMVGAHYRPTDDLLLASHLYYVDTITTKTPGLPFLTQGIDSYLRLDLRAEYEFWGDQAAFSVGVRNLLDSHHPEGTSDNLNMSEVPRMVFAELRLRLK